MVRQWLYKKFAKLYVPNVSPSHIKLIAQLLEKLLGHAVFNYGGIKITAGPYAFLDHYIICHDNINPYVTSAISQYLCDGGVFLDMGAHHGVFSLLAAKNPKTKVFAFEPSPRELTRLWRNLQLNKKFNNISVLAFGLGAEEKEQDFILSADDNPGKNSLPIICDKGKKVQANFSRLIKLLSTDVLEKTRLCKLDIEGQEMFVLNSLKEHMHLLKKCVFVVEMHKPFLTKAGFSTNDIYQFFNQTGFKSQFGNPHNVSQWEEFFFHPGYASPLRLMEDFN